jgi:hypothetical protein
MSPSDIARDYEVSPGVYLVGALERGVTVRKQQVRALNLIWALRELGLLKGDIAVVGGGISGLTAAAAIMGCNGDYASITLFEQLWDLCPLQQGCDVRWLHPNIYDWPAPFAETPSAGLPVHDWRAGRASDVARAVLRSFSQYCDAFSEREPRIKLGLQRIEITAEEREIAWVGSSASRRGAYFHRGPSEETSQKFNTIVVTAGYGLEKSPQDYPVTSYWRNDHIGQPALDGKQRAYVVSGYGDGALIDLFRLTIERFRQDTIISELFGSRARGTANSLHQQLEEADSSDEVFDYLKQAERTILAEALSAVGQRLRKDTSVVLHATGRNGQVKSPSEIFGKTSSRFNRILTYLLYRSDAFSLSFEPLHQVSQITGVHPNHILCRHGTDTVNHLKKLFVDSASVEPRLGDMKRAQAQSSAPLFPLGAFAVIP